MPPDGEDDQRPDPDALRDRPVLREDGAGVRARLRLRRPRRAVEHAPHRRAVQREDRARDAEDSRVQAPSGRDFRRTAARERGGRVRGASRRAAGAGRRDAARPRGGISPPPRLRAFRHREHGIFGLLSDRLGFHQVGQGAGDPGGAGARGALPEAWSPSACGSPRSIPSPTSCSSSGSSTRSGSASPTSTATSARTGGTR